MNDFLLRVANILEVAEVSQDLEFRTVPGWGSMMGFALFIMLEDEYGCKITLDEFRKLKFVSDLISVVPEFDSEK